MKYRIVQVNYKNGVTEFRVDCKYWGFFWSRHAVRKTLDDAILCVEVQKHLDGFAEATETIVKRDE